jgi:hypothetical protein
MPPVRPQDAGASALQPTSLQPEAATIQSSSAGVPQHVMTAASIYGYGGTPTSVPLSKISPYLTWADTSPQYAGDVRSAGIKVDPYVLFWRDSASQSPNTGYNLIKPNAIDGAARARTCSGTSILASDPPDGLLLDPRQLTQALAVAKSVVDYTKSEYGSNWDAIYSDDVASPYGLSANPCNYVDSTWVGDTNEVDYYVGAPIWVNALNDAEDATTRVPLVTPSNVLGAVCESCYTNNNPDRAVTGSLWTNRETAEIEVIGKGKIFWVYPRASGNAVDERNLRMYAFASFLLTYQPARAMIQEAFETPSGFPVFPETGLVPENPMETESTIGGYRQPSGAYLREFSDCYYRGVNKGRCGVFINPGSATVTLTQRVYAHSLYLDGYGVADGGTVYFDGGKVTSLAPGTAAILFI